MFYILYLYVYVWCCIISKQFLFCSLFLFFFLIYIILCFVHLYVLDVEMNKKYIYIYTNQITHIFKQTRQNTIRNETLFIYICTIQITNLLVFYLILFKLKDQSIKNYVVKLFRLFFLLNPMLENWKSNSYRFHHWVDFLLLQKLHVDRLRVQMLYSWAGPTV